jgi:hypothetical protein
VLCNVQPRLRDGRTDVGDQLVERDDPLRASAAHFEVLFHAFELLRRQVGVGKAQELGFAGASLVGHGSFSSFCFKALSP